MTRAQPLREVRASCRGAALMACIALGCAARLSEPTATPLARSSRAATIAVPPWRLALAPAVSTAAPFVPSRCAATPGTSFHLRPRAVGASIGPVLPAGTTLEVLALSGVQRTQGFGGVRAPVLARVRVVADEREGFAFVGPAELSAGCPLLSGARAASGDHLARIGHAWRVNYALEFGARPIPPRLLTGWSTPFDPARDTLLERVDLDHNGAQETLFKHVEDAVHTLVLWRGTRGVPGLVLTQEWDHDHHSITYEGSVHAGRAVYFVVQHWSIGSCSVACSGITCDETGRTLYRLHPDGYFVEVASLPVTVAGEDIDLRGDGDDDLVATGHTSGRAQRLRWNPTDFSLTPEGDQLPPIEAPPRGFCAPRA